MVRKKKKLLPASLIVTQSNELVSARYNLPLGEQRLILTMIAKIQPEDGDFTEYRINVKEFAHFLDIDKNSIYREFRKIQKSIVSRVLLIQEEDGPLAIGWVSSAKYIDKEGAILLSFDPKLKPYLLQLKGNFTSCKLEMLLSFKSQYTMRVYTLLKQHEKLKERQIEIGELREMLGLANDQHREYKHFKSNILLPTQKELAEKSDLNFEFNEIKYGRKVGAINFRIHLKKSSDVLTDKSLTVIPKPEFPFVTDKVLPAAERLLWLIPELHRTKKTVQAAIQNFEKKHGFDYVKRNILYSNAKAEKCYAGFLNNALKSDWGLEWEVAQRDAKILKKPLEIWERQGFKSAKAYDEFMYQQQMAEYDKSLRKKTTVN